MSLLKTGLVLLAAALTACASLLNDGSSEKIRKRIERIKAELAGIDEMRTGSLTRQYKDTARQRGAYYQLSYTHQMKSRTEYVARAGLPVVVPAMKF